MSTWITAALRNEQFFSLAELNQAIRKKLRKYNEANFEKKEGSRLSLFLEEEKPLLAALPAARFELAEHRTATVQFNYHVAVDKMYYSVPYQYIKDKVDVRITDTTIEVFKNNRRIASHRRLYGRPGTLPFSNICRRTTRNIWNGTVTASANGRKQSEPIHARS